VNFVLSEGVKSPLGRCSPKIKPSTTDVDVRQVEHVPQQRAIRVRVSAVDDGMAPTIM